MRNWKKKTAAWLTLVSLCLTAAACGEKPDGSGDGEKNISGQENAGGQGGEARQENTGKEVTPEPTGQPEDDTDPGETSYVRKTDLVESCLVPNQLSGNPVISHIFTADPSAHVWDDGKIYIYASHDMDPARGCDLMDRYHVFSSWDMVNWLDEGEILSSDDVSWGRPEGGFMWAPDCAYHDGKYYFYYPHPSGSDWNTTWKIGVAVSDKPNKDFADWGYIEGIGGDAMIDPCVFIDDDDRVYMYYGGGGMCRGAEMNADMLSMKEEMRPMEGLNDFHEAAWVFKREGIYYLVYSDNQHNANRMQYAVSANPLGPWTSQGVFLEATGCDTSHGSVVEYEGQWYLFYHNQKVSGAGNLRSVCIDKLEFDENGAIVKVVQTREGVPSIRGEIDTGYFDEIYSSAAGYDVVDCILEGSAEIHAKTDGTGEAAVYNLHAEDARCTFTNIDGGEGGRATVFFHYASGEQWTKFRVLVNGVDYSLINGKTTNSWTDYSGVTTICVPLEPGTDNTITIAGGYGGINVDGIVVALFRE